MINDDQNNLSWIKKVAEFKDFQDEDVLSDADAWQRLQQRYPKKRKYFYWAAAALLVVMLVSPLLWNKKHGTTINRSQNASTVRRKILPTPIEHLSIIPDSINSVVRQEIKKQKTGDNKNYNQHLFDVHNTINDKLKHDTSYFVKNDIDSSHNIKKVIAVAAHPDSTDDNENEIVHINNVDSDQPTLKQDITKWRKFTRRYELDIPNKEAATSSINPKPSTQKFN
ncbi:MAG: hypothetical protein ABIN36_16755 [Ferruginibacter sp.]